VDVHDITTAQAKAALSLNIARNVLNRVVQGWRDLINTR
jgi:flagellar hook-basal body complex protein FliE